MSALSITCTVISCDGCGDKLTWSEDTGEAHFDSRAEAVEQNGDEDHGWGWDMPDAGPDLCPRCICKRDGHAWGEPFPASLDDTGDEAHVCERCSVIARVETATA